MTDHDPMLDGITRWDLYVSTKLDVLPVVAVDGEYVLFSDLPALIARVREDERGKTIVSYDLMKQRKSYEQGQRDEREACIAAVSAPTLHDDSCCSNGCTLMHSSEWEATRRIQIVLGFPLSEEPPPPYRCDGSCNCTAAAFIAAIRAREEKPNG